MNDLHLSAFAPRWRFLYAARFDAYDVKSFGEEVCEYGFYNQGAMRSTNSSYN